MKTRVNLYKNCILSARNTEVFRSRAILEEYLETLDKPYTIDIDITNVYTTLSGKITIDATPLNGDFNYIKFEEFDDIEDIKQTVYAFIDSFRIVNDLLVIYYSVDIWHTYFEKCTLRESLLVNTLIPSNYNSPVWDCEYKPFGYSQFQEITALSKARNGAPDYGFSQMGIIAEITTFRSTNYTADIKLSNPKKYVCFVGIIEDTTIKGWYNKVILRDLINAFVSCQSSGLNIGAPTYKAYYNITRLFIVNKQFITDYTTGINAYVSDNNVPFTYTYTDEGGTTTFGLFDISDYGEAVTPISFDIPDNIKNISFGFKTKQFPISFMGNIHRINLTASFKFYQFKYFLKYDNQMIDITDAAEIEIPFNTISGAEIETRKLANETQKNIYQTQEIVRGITGVTSSVTGMLQSTVGFGIGAVTGSPSAINAGITGIEKTINSSANMYADMYTIEQREKELENRQYQNITAVKTLSDAFINMDNDIVIRQVKDTESNVSLISKYIEEFGYSTNIIVNEILSSVSIPYDVIKFKYVRIVGLSTEISETIASILKRGVKIWYTKNV